MSEKKSVLIREFKRLICKELNEDVKSSELSNAGSFKIHTIEFNSFTIDITRRQESVEIYGLVIYDKENTDKLVRVIVTVLSELIKKEKLSYLRITHIEGKEVEDAFEGLDVVQYGDADNRRKIINQ